MRAGGFALRALSDTRLITVMSLPVFNVDVKYDEEKGVSAWK